ncbi:MAG: nucleotidyltransferase family protein, partial [Candidatus Binataceae bacterium]
AAGRGERLRPRTATVPKPLLELGGRPLIHYPLLMLKRAGITEIAINVHHLAGTLQEALGTGASLDIHITWAPEPVLLGTGGPLHNLQSFFGDETFAIANSDTIMDLDFAAMVARHRDRGGLATLALATTSEPTRYSKLEIDADARIRRMRLLAAKPPLEFADYPVDLREDIARQLSSYMYAGAIVAEPAVFELMPATPPWSLMTGLFAPMVARGLAVFGYVHRGYFRTVDDLAGYRSLAAELLSSPPPLRYLD